MKRTLATLLLLALCSTLATAQIKALQIGKLTYIGESSDGTASFFTVKLGNRELVSPLIFNTITVAVVGATGSLGPIVGTGPYTTPTEILINDTTQPPINGHTCPCLVAAVQLSMSSNPTVTIALKNGQSFTTSSTVNVYLEAPHGQSAIQLQQSAPIYLHAVQ